MPGGPNVVCVLGARWAPVEGALDVDVTNRIAESRSAVRESVADGAVDCVLVGSDLTDGSSTDVLRSVREVDRGLPVVLWPDGVDAEAATGAVRHDATEYLPAADPGTVADRLETTLGEDGRGGDPSVGTTVRDADDWKRRERALTALNASTRELMDARDDGAVARIAVATAKDVLGLAMNAVFFHDGETDRLEPVTWTDETEAVLGEPPSLPLGDSLAGTAFEEGEPVVHADLGTEPGRYNPDTPFGSEMILPLGPHGVLAVADIDVGAFDAIDETLAGILAASVEAALSRGVREQALWRYRATIENVRDLLFALDDEGRIALVTDPLAELLGYDASELTGCHVETMLSRTGLEEGIALTYHASAGGTDGQTSYETVVEPVDGDPIPVEIELSLMDDGDTCDGLVGVVRDRSEIEQAREELATARDRFSYLFEHIPDAVVEAEFVDGEPVVRSVNPAFDDVFGFDLDDVLGSSLNDYVLTDDLHGSGRALDDNAIDGNVTTARVERKTASGLRDFLFRGVPYDTDGDTVRGFGIYTDVTEQTERERRLGVLTNVLRHNLRTEMNLVLGHANAIVEADPRAEVVGLVEELRESAEAVVELGETARDLEALIERTWGTDRSVDLVALTESVRARVSTRHPSATVGTDLPGSAPVVGDESLERALYELVENAIVHAEGAADVDVTVQSADDEWIDLLVRDDGPGIPAFERELLSGEREVTQLQHGSGLGLWIAQWTVESLGGSVTLLDREPDGTVAKVRLRRAR